MLTGFYRAFSPACFALLGLWLVVVQIRLREWQGSTPHMAWLLLFDSRYSSPAAAG